MSKLIRFGIIGPGKIAGRFASAFAHIRNATVGAVASRDEQRADSFARQYHIPKVYSSYAALLADRDIDVVYVATPHTFHCAQTLASLRAGKAVICEKPLALNLRQATEMIETARQQRLFLMEAMWSRFFASTHKVLSLIAAGAIGEVKYVHADFGFSAPVNPDGRVYNLALGGGAQLDVGVYPLFLALLILGRPSSVKSSSQLASSGADATTSAILTFPSGAMANVLSSIVADSPKEAHIMGTLGRITMAAPWHKSQRVTLWRNTGEVHEFPFPFSGNGFQFQIEEVVKCLTEGKTESDLMPHSLSLLMAEVSDEILRQGGVTYAS